MTIASVIFVLRRSPDWPSLAEDFRRGVVVPPALYLPERPVPAFPATIPECIARWNATYEVDFFTCRATLRRIARATLDGVVDGTVLTHRQLAARSFESDERIFFLDDDDWFAPDTVVRLSGVRDADVAVFPLPRLDAPVFTFVRTYDAESPILGRISRFSHRYQTNNYALHPRTLTDVGADAMADHIEASTVADRLELRDEYCDVMVSATNKSPVSASVLCRILQDERGFRDHVAEFVRSLIELRLPDHARWMREPIEQTVDLFKRAAGGCLGEAGR